MSKSGKGCTHNGQLALWRGIPGMDLLGALDDSQRETLYNLLQQAAGTAVSCTAATAEGIGQTS